jgi:hypothetical protein
LARIKKDADEAQAAQVALAAAKPVPDNSGD